MRVLLLYGVEQAISLPSLFLSPLEIEITISSSAACRLLYNVAFSSLFLLPPLFFLRFLFFFTLLLVFFIIYMLFLSFWRCTRALFRFFSVCPLFLTAVSFFSMTSKRTSEPKSTAATTKNDCSQRSQNDPPACCVMDGRLHLFFFLHSTHRLRSLSRF
jgi:hypothetical protein